jgi:hypothetical protein
MAWASAPFTVASWLAAWNTRSVIFAARYRHFYEQFSENANENPARIMQKQRKQLCTHP